MTNILYTSRGGDPYGAKKSLLSLMEGLDRSRFRPVLVCPEPGFLSEKAGELGLPVRILPIYDFFFTSNPLLLSRQGRQLRDNVASLRQLLREERIDLVHVNSFKVGPPYSIAARTLGIPCVWHIREILITSPLRKKILTQMIRHLPDAVITVSRACLPQLTGRNSRDGKMHLIYNGIDSNAFRAQAHGQTVRKELHISADAPLMGCVGQLIPWKGQDDFLRVAARVLDRVPEARFLIVGKEAERDDTYSTSLRELAAKLGIRDRVIFTGFRQDAPSLMDSMDILVHCPVQPDPLPRVILEAMALGKPVVAVLSGGVPEMVVAGVTGILAPPRDVDSLADAAISLLEDRHLAARMGQAARARVQQHFSLASHVESVMQLYDELTQRSRR